MSDKIRDICEGGIHNGSLDSFSIPSNVMVCLIGLWQSFECYFRMVGDELVGRELTWTVRRSPAPSSWEHTGFLFFLAHSNPWVLPQLSVDCIDSADIDHGATVECELSRIT